ncbi:hypothetical protein PCASD_26891 [Puccinia coronata f. sp. avenae]|uniref:Uncharacterized protein n=1 Tax=Puccinia coronata f. sp. avenae TaxID=200324 RepID=A0A2N5RWR3_9BASI|nr:hypothetical protein PCASD_26891 [Puccinia coronata f. sp. avenae]
MAAEPSWGYLAGGHPWDGKVHPRCRLVKTSGCAEPEKGSGTSSLKSEGLGGRKAPPPQSGDLQRRDLCLNSSGFLVISYLEKMALKTAQNLKVLTPQLGLKS